MAQRAHKAWENGSLQSSGYLTFFEAMKEMRDEYENFMSENDPEVYWDFDGEMIFEEDHALAILLRDERLLVNGFMRGGVLEEEAVHLLVLCNDIFAWGMADLEPIALKDIQTLYDMHVADKTCGTYKWCCIHRNEKPQAPVEKWFRETGAWDETMDSLPENKYDASWREYRKQKERENG